MITIDQLRKALVSHGFSKLGPVIERIGKTVFLIDETVAPVSTFGPDYKNQITVYNNNGRLNVVVDCDRRDVDLIVGALTAAGLNWPSNANGTYDINT